MKKLTIMLMLAFTPACALVDNVFSSFKTAYEVGKVRGKQEILRELEENKKKLKELNRLVVKEMALLTQKKNGNEDGVITLLIPAISNYLLVLRERQNLKAELKVAEKSVPRGTTSDSVPTGRGDSARIMEQEMSPD